MDNQTMKRISRPKPRTFKQNDYMRDAAYMVAIRRVVEAMEMRGWF